jgi:hypothetical protein
VLTASSFINGGHKSGSRGRIGLKFVIYCSGGAGVGAKAEGGLKKINSFMITSFTLLL